MKKFKKLTLLFCITIFSFQLVACNKEVPASSTEAPITFEKQYEEGVLDTFTNPHGTFSIDLPKEWLQDASAGVDTILAAQDESMPISVMITKYSKDSSLLEDIKEDTLDAFINLYEEKGIPKLLTMVTPSPLEAVSLDNFPNAKGYEIAFAEDDINNKGYYLYTEGKDAFYAITISGKTALYDEHISKLKGTLNTLKEFEIQRID